MLRKSIISVTVICLLVISILVALNVNFNDIFSIQEESIINYEDVKLINNEKLFGRFIDVEINDKTVANGEGNKTISKLVFKLFGLIPIREINIDITEYDPVYLGGVPVGFSLKTNGLIVIGSNPILTKNGNVDILENSNLKMGDIIIEINKISVFNAEDINKILNMENIEESELEIKVIRKNEEKIVKLKALKENETEMYKLGLWVKDDASGVGTLTYVDSNKNFAALGHPITDSETGNIIPSSEGKVYECSVVGLNKGTKGVPGELRGIFLQGKESKGIINKNCKYGVYGKINNSSGLVDENQKVEVGGRLTVKPGKATLISSISGVREEYEIEIIKANYQPKSSDKSFVFRVKDKKLLDKTGGIIQGMSGSPILQNGKLIGAVTHVFVSDPTKGYGIYIDWMLAE